MTMLEWVKEKEASVDARISRRVENIIETQAGEEEKISARISRRVEKHNAPQDPADVPAEG